MVDKGLNWSEMVWTIYTGLDKLKGYVVGLRRICRGSKLDAIGLMRVFNGLRGRH